MADGQSNPGYRPRLIDRVAFACGVVFHTGPRKITLGERIEALPIATIWGPR